MNTQENNGKTMTKIQIERCAPKYQIGLRYLSLLVWILVVNIPLVSNGQEAGKNKADIHFIENSLSDAMKQAKAQKKIIFIDAFTVWCVPCKQLRKTTFKNAELAAYFNDNFINVSLDAEKGEGIPFAAKYNLRGYPTLYFINGEGELIAKNEGLIGTDALLTLAKQITKEISAAKDSIN